MLAGRILPLALEEDLLPWVLGGAKPGVPGVGCSPHSPSCPLLLTGGCWVPGEAGDCMGHPEGPKMPGAAGGWECIWEQQVL